MLYTLAIADAEYIMFQMLLQAMLFFCANSV
jgi:hypothetical protein